LDDLQVEADLLSLEIPSAKVGDAVEIYGASVEKKVLGGDVAKIYPAGFTKLSSLGVEQQRVKIIIRLSNQAKEFLRGQNVGVDYRVRIRIITSRKEEATVIPRAALFRGENGGWRIFVVRNGRAERVDVDVGLMNDRRAEIISGVAPKEQVVLAPDNELTDGMQVTGS
jgi:HlyD family secretion protein